MTTPASAAVAVPVAEQSREPASVLESSIRRFEEWLQAYGETSFDFQTLYANQYGRFAKSLYYRNRPLGTLAVAPLVFCEAFVPSARSLVWKQQRFPIADAHYAMAFARLYRHGGERRHLERAVHFLDVLLESSAPGESGLGWGYPFDWETIDGTIPRGTPLITTLPYVYEAVAAVYELDRRERWRTVMQSIAAHALRDYQKKGRSGRKGGMGGRAATCTYTPMASDRGMVVNANAYRSFLLTKAACDLENDELLTSVEPNLQFVLAAQRPEGSWPYATDQRRPFVDHFHTCFVLKALVKIVQLTPRADCQQAIDRGLRYYADQLFDAEGLPRPFAKRPRLIVYRRELYDYAEAINLLTLVRGRSRDLDALLQTTVADVLARWQRTDGSFRTRQLFAGWDEVPMHRWAQAQLFRSLCGLLGGAEEAKPLHA
ncbi:MAG: hypothetical protein AB7F99_17470 [Vicinamibacterales bacterium]